MWDSGVVEGSARFGATQVKHSAMWNQRRRQRSPFSDRGLPESIPTSAIVELSTAAIVTILIVSIVTMPAVPT